MSRPDQHPAFWNEYIHPKTAIATLLQQPAFKINADTLATAYMEDFRRSRRGSTSEA